MSEHTWKNILPQAPAPPSPTVPSEAAPAPERPRVEIAEPADAQNRDNTDPAYWTRKATPAEIARAEAFQRAEERRHEAEERLRAQRRK